MNYRVKIATTLVAAITAIAANAQSLEKAVVRAEPLQYTKTESSAAADSISSCSKTARHARSTTSPSLSTFG